MNPKMWPFLLLSLLLSLNSTSFAHTCVTVFGNSRVSDIVYFTTPHLQSVSNEWQRFLSSPFTANQEYKQELIQKFTQSYKGDFSEIQNTEQLLIFYKKVRDILNSEAASHLFDAPAMRGLIRPIFEEIFNHAHGPLFRKLAPLMSPYQRDELFEVLYSIQWLTPFKRSLDETRQVLWRLVWLARINIVPEVALQELALLIEISDRSQLPTHLRNATIASIQPHHSDIVESFSNLPENLRQLARQTYLNKFDGLKKSYPGLLFLNKLNHMELRELAQNLQNLSHNKKISAKQLITEVDEYWERVGYGVQDKKLRGGYSFQTVLQTARASQDILQISLGPLHMLYRHKLYIFGSFINGRAKIHQAENESRIMDSDIDITFERHSDFHKRSLRSDSWYFKADKSSQHFIWLLQLENAMAKGLNLENYQPGTLLSPVTDITSYQVLEMNQPVEGMAYVTLASPLVLEVTSRRIIFHIHYLKENSVQPQTESFEIVL